MSSVVISTSAALRRPFLFDDYADPNVGSPATDSKKPAGRQQQPSIPLVTPASQLSIRPAPETASSGISALDSLTGGLPRGCLTEICGPASSGRTTVLLAALAAATRRGEFCALLDATDAIDPHSLAAAGLDLDRLLWVRCGENSPKRPRGTEKNVNMQSEYCLEQVLHATDLLLESGGFGVIVLDLADVPPQAARRIPLATWFRFRRAVEHKPTILLAIEQQPIAGSCSSLLLRLQTSSSQFSVLSSQDIAPRQMDEQEQKLSHTQLLTGLEISVELIRSRLDRKLSSSVTFETQTAWAG